MQQWIKLEKGPLFTKIDGFSTIYFKQSVLFMTIFKTEKKVPNALSSYTKYE